MGGPLAASAFTRHGASPRGDGEGGLDGPMKTHRATLPNGLELEATADDVRSLTATLFAPGVGHLAFSGSQAHHRALTTALASL
ncbi:MAG: hypothetical protein AMXMBFR34_23300 [Myxococcaceae bacterium]